MSFMILTRRDEPQPPISRALPLAWSISDDNPLEHDVPLGNFELARQLARNR